MPQPDALEQRPQRRGGGGIGAEGVFGIGAGDLADGVGNLGGDGTGAAAAERAD